MVPHLAPSDETALQADVEAFGRHYAQIESQLRSVLVGQSEVLDQVLVCLLAGGHALLEGAPGLGKTLLVRTLADALELSFSRIQFTPDLMPTDITGGTVVVDEGNAKRFRFEPGPVFAHLVLADEINRATPKTQSALLEAMQERTVSVARTTHPLPEPFFVLATQNPLEMEGTYPLPEAQLDRFLFKIHVAPPSAAELVTILGRTTGHEIPRAAKVADAPRLSAMKSLARTVPVAQHVADYVARLTLATHPQNPDASPTVRKYVRYGCSPRGAQAVILAAKVLAMREGRLSVSFDDVRRAVLPAMRHRLILSFEGLADNASADAILREVIGCVPQTRA